MPKTNGQLWYARTSVCAFCASSRYSHAVCKFQWHCRREQNRSLLAARQGQIFLGRIVLLHHLSVNPLLGLVSWLVSQLARREELRHASESVLDAWSRDVGQQRCCSSHFLLPPLVLVLGWKQAGSLLSVSRPASNKDLNEAWQLGERARAAAS
jgi:hypothetical protein